MLSLNSRFFRTPWLFLWVLLWMLWTPFSPAQSSIDVPIRTFGADYGSFFTVAFSPDGKYVLTGHWNSARLWDLQTGKFLREYSGYLGNITTVAFSPDGRQVLTNNKYNTATLYDTQTGTPLQTFAGHTGLVRSLAFRPGSKDVLTGSSDGTAKLWDIQTGKPLKTFTVSHTPVTSVAFSPDGTRILTGSIEDLPRLWNVEGATLLQAYPGVTGDVLSVGFSPDGKRVLAGSTDGANLWETEGGKLLQTFPHPGFVRAVAFSPDGKRILTGSTDTNVRLWDADTGKMLQLLGGSEGFINAVAFSPDGQWILSGGEEKDARLWKNPFFSPSSVLTAASTPAPDAPPAVTSTAASEVSSTPDAPKATPAVSFKLVTPQNDEQVQEGEHFDVFLTLSAPLKDTSVLIEVGDQSLYAKTVTTPQKQLVLPDLQWPSMLSGKQNLRVRVGEVEQNFTVTFPQKQQPNLYFLGIGVTRFQESSTLPRLTYTVPDVQAVADFFHSQQGRHWKDVDIQLLFNQNATQQNVLSAFQALLMKKPRPEDTVVVFISSHGMPVYPSSSSTRPTFYAALYDTSVPQKPPFMESDVKEALSDSQIAAFLKWIPSNTLLILDTCYAGAVGSKGVRGDPKAIGVVSLSESDTLRNVASPGSNKVILSSTDATSVSYEDAKWQHGAFTYALLDQLERASKQNDPLSVSVLMGTVSDRVYRMTLSESLGPQTPELIGNRFLYVFPVGP